MKRVLALLLVTVLTAAACGGGSSGSGSGSGGSSSGQSAADILKASQDALKSAKSASFDVTVSLKLDGNLQGAGAGAALLQGPLSLSLKGQAGTADAGSGKFDVHFALNFTGGSFSGEALSPDGKTAYIQMPTLLGPGWKSIDISKQTSSSMGGSDGSTNQGLDQLKALGRRPDEVAQESQRLDLGQHRHDRGGSRRRRADRRHLLDLELADHAQGAEAARRGRERHQDRPRRRRRSTSRRTSRAPSPPSSPSPSRRISRRTRAA